MLGEGHPDTLAAINNLALVFGEVGSESAEHGDTYNKELAQLESKAKDAQKLYSALQRSKVRFAKKTVRNDIAGRNTL